MTHVTAEMMRDALRRHFGGDAWALAFEVGHATGFESSRHADAVAMNLWPSRGLTIEGVEIKVSRSDWQRELADPAKAEKIAQHCDRWWLAVGPGVLKDNGDVPLTWGILEWQESLAVAGKPPLKVARHAAKLNCPADVKRPFVAALLRAFSKIEHAIINERLNKMLSAQREIDRKNWEAERQSHRDEAAKRLAKLTAAFSEHDLRWLDDDEICRAAALLLKHGVVGTYRGLGTAMSALVNGARTSLQIAQAIQEGAAAIGLEVVTDEEREEMAAIVKKLQRKRAA